MEEQHKINQVKEFKIKEKTASSVSIISSIASFLGGYQVCHSVCTAIVAILAALGIIVIGMPLAFLQKVAVPFWIVAIILFLISLSLYMKMKCISKNILLFNFGIIVAAFPFFQGSMLQYIFWSIGGIFVAAAISLFIKNKLKRRTYESFI